MLKLNYELNVNQLSNPILCALLICIVYSVIIALLAKVSFSEIQQITIINFMIVSCLLYLHYNQVRKLYENELMQEKSNIVLDRLTTRLPPQVDYSNDIIVNDY